MCTKIERSSKKDRQVCSMGGFQQCVNTNTTDLLVHVGGGRSNFPVAEQVRTGSPLGAKPRSQTCATETPQGCEPASLGGTLVPYGTSAAGHVIPSAERNSKNSQHGQLKSKLESFKDTETQVQGVVQSLRVLCFLGSKQSS